MQSVPQVSQEYNFLGMVPLVEVPLDDAPLASAVASVALIGREDFDVVW